jgi:hypothetical protein
MPHPSPDTSVSITEDLDPEPAVRTERAYVREAVLGLVLLLAVIGWAGWQWWGQESLQNNYRLAQRAEAGRDWDEAHARYAAAAGYKDSAARAAQAARIISERDGFYRDALSRVEQKQWSASIKALERLDQVQPGYADSARLRGYVESQIRSEALQGMAGTVAVRTGADPPGLYYRSAGGWVWLEGSDPWSTIHAAGPAGHLLYDVAGADWSPHAPILPAVSPTPDSGESEPGRPQFAGRRLMLATPRGDKIESSPLALDPSYYDFFVLSERGIWAFRRPVVEPTGSWQMVIGAYLWIFEADYLAFNATTAAGARLIAPLRLPGPEWMVADIPASGERILLLELREPGGRHPGEATPANPNRLYVANPDATDPRAVYTFTGQLRAVQISPDARHALLRIDDPLFDGNAQSNLVRQSVVLVSLEDGEDTILLQRPLPASLLGQSEVPIMGGSFVARGPLAGKVVLMDWRRRDLNGPRNRAGNPFSLLSIIDPDRPRVTPIVLRIDGEPFTHGNPVALVVTEQNHGPAAQTLLVRPVQWGGSVPMTNTMTVATVVTDLPASPHEGLSLDVSYTVARLPLDKQEIIQGMRMRGDNLVYNTVDFAGHAGSVVPYAVRSVPLSDLSGGQVSPVEAYRGTEPSETFSPYRASWVAGDNWLAYVKDGELHARSYLGDADVVVEDGVTNLYTFGWAEMWASLR